MDRKAVPWFRHQKAGAPCSFGNRPRNMILNIYFDKKKVVEDNNFFLKQFNVEGL